MIWLYGALYGLCFGLVSGRGGTGRVDLDHEGEERTYPSMVRLYYYESYIRYFTPSGFYYARHNIYNTRTVSICTNYEPYFNNGTYLGEFPCPMVRDPDDYNHCCGENGYEYCCRALDALSIRIGIGFGSAAGLGLLVALVACIISKVKNRKKENQIKTLSESHMEKKGIPKYEDRKTKHFVAKQSIDGYQVLVMFRKKPFYQRFYEELRLKYVDISWRYDDTELVTEGKIALDDDNWVNLVLCDDFEGSPVMIVMREKPSVVWMTTQFDEICAKIPVEKGFMGCCGGKNKTYPAQDSKARDSSRDKDYITKDGDLTHVTGSDMTGSVTHSNSNLLPNHNGSTPR